MKNALEKISSDIQTLMEQNTFNAAEVEDENAEETVLEDEQSTKAIVLRLANRGMSQAQIVQRLGLPREEVALMLSIAEDR